MTFEHSGDPEVKLLLSEGGDRWCLLRDWSFDWLGTDGREVHRVVPAGLVTDFGSIPRIYRWRFSPTGRAAAAFLAHDWLYAEAVEPREVCDRVMLEAMEATGVNWWDRHVMYRAVRAFGGFAYGKQRNANGRTV